MVSCSRDIFPQKSFNPYGKKREEKKRKPYTIYSFHYEQKFSWVKTIQVKEKKLSGEILQICCNSFQFFSIIFLLINVVFDLCVMLEWESGFGSAICEKKIIFIQKVWQQESVTNYLNATIDELLTSSFKYIR